MAWRSSAWHESPEVARLLRFAVVGSLATVVYIAGTHLLHDRARISIAAAASICFVLVVAMNYVLHYSWTFRSRRPHRHAVPRFLATAGGGMAVNYVAVALGQRWLSVPQTVVLLLGVAFVVIWNYLLARCWVFPDDGAAG